MTADYHWTWTWEPAGRDEYCVECGYPFDVIDEDGTRTKIIVDDGGQTFCGRKCLSAAHRVKLEELPKAGGGAKD